MRCYFHVYDKHGSLIDFEGREVVDMSEVRSHALKAIRSLIADDVMNGVIDLDGNLEVTVDGGEAVLLMPFTDAVRR